MAKPVAIAVVAFENWPQVFVTYEDGSVYRGGESHTTGLWTWDRLPALPLTPAGDAEANDFDPIKCSASRDDRALRRVALLLDGVRYVRADDNMDEAASSTGQEVMGG